MNDQIIEQALWCLLRVKVDVKALKAIYAHQPSKEDAVKQLRKHFGSGGRSITLPDGRTGFAEYDGRGIHIKFRDSLEETKITWTRAEKQIRQMIEEDGNEE